MIAVGSFAFAQSVGPRVETVALRAGVVSITEEAGQAYCVDISPDGSRIVIGTESGGLKIRDSGSGKVLQVLHQEPSPERPEDLDKAMDLKRQFPFEEDYWPVLAVAFDPAGSQVAAAIPMIETAPDGKFHGVQRPTCCKIRIWDLKSGQFRPNPPRNPSSVRALAFDRSGEHVHTLDITACLARWDVRSGRRVGSIGEWPRALLVGSPDHLDTAFGGWGNHAITVMNDWVEGEPENPPAMKLWDLDRKQFRNVALAPLGGTTPAETATLSPDGEWGAIVATDGDVHFFDFHRALPMGQLKLSGGPGHKALSFRPDGRRLVAVDGSGLAKICEVPGGLSRQIYQGPAGAVRAIRWLPDRIILVSGGFELIPSKNPVKTLSTVEPIRFWSIALDRP